MSRARTFADLATASEAGSVANRNMIINGDMAVAQRGVSKTGFDKDTSGLFHVVDRWGLDIGTTAGAFTVTQDTDNTAPFNEALKIATTTDDTSIAAGEYVLLHQSIEGLNCARMRKGNSDASAITISFYVKGNAAATYQFNLRDTDNDRIYNDVFSVTTSWSRVVLTLPGDTNGEYLDQDANASLQMYIWLHAGSTYTGGTYSSKTWADRSNWNTTVNSSNTSILDSTSRTFFITGVQMELGEVATPFEHESYADNLARCQRYFQQLNRDQLAGYQSGTTALYGTYFNPVEMRADPTSTYSLSYISTSQSGGAFANKTITGITTAKYGSHIEIIYAIGGGAGGSDNTPLGLFHNGTLSLDAEI